MGVWRRWGEEGQMDSAKLGSMMHRVNRIHRRNENRVAAEQHPCGTVEDLVYQ